MFDVCLTCWTPSVCMYVYVCVCCMGRSAYIFTIYCLCASLDSFIALFTFVCVVVSLALWYGYRFGGPKLTDLFDNIFVENLFTYWFSINSWCDVFEQLIATHFMAYTVRLFQYIHTLVCMNVRVYSVYSINTLHGLILMCSFMPFW